MTEFVLETVIRDGLGELKTDINRLDDIFAGFLEAHFLNQYGQVKIDQLKTYIQNNQIKIVQALTLAPVSMPCISIQMISSSEEESLQEFSNMLPEEDTPIDPPVRVPVVTPGTYDILTGKMTVTNAADLSVICPGMIFVDASNNEFIIRSGNSNLSGNKYINIDRNQTPDLSDDGQIVSPIDFFRTDKRMIRLRENIRIGCHANNDVHLAKFLYILVIYILKSRQMSLETRGLALDRGIASAFDREESFQGEHVFSRYIDMSCITQFEWNQEIVNLVDCFDLTVRAPAPNPDSSGTIIITEEDGN